MGDSLTIESAIKHAEEVAEENREYAEDALDRYNLVPNEITKQEHDRCKQCAAEYSQLVEWLKEYKRLLEREPCEDAISRAEAIRIASGYCYYTNIPKELEKLPAVQPEPKTEVLDKIRAEIEEQKENRCFDDMFAYIITGLDDALEIIDKYKAESEDKECK